MSQCCATHWMAPRWPSSSLPCTPWTSLSPDSSQWSAKEPSRLPGVAAAVSPVSMPLSPGLWIVSTDRCGRHCWSSPRHARLTADEAALMLGDLAAQHETTAEGLLRGLVRVSLVDLDGYQYRLLDTIRGAARRALYADAEFCSRARAMLHGAAAALVDVDNDFSLVHLDDPQADRLLLFEEAVLDAWRDRTPGLGEVWMTLGYIAFAQPLSDRLRAPRRGGPGGPGHHGDPARRRSANRRRSVHLEECRRGDSVGRETAVASAEPQRRAAPQVWPLGQSTR